MTTALDSINPFSTLSSTFDPNSYYGSQDLVKLVLERMSRPVPSAIELLGLPGMGKSFLLQYIADPKGAIYQNKDSLHHPFRDKPLLLFPLLVEFRLLPTNMHPFSYLYQRFHEAYRKYREYVASEANLDLPEFDDSGEVKIANNAISSLEADLRVLKEKMVRPVFLLDDFHLAFDIEHMNFSQTTRLRPLRDRVAFILVTERSLEQVNPEASGSPFFQMIDKIRFGGLNPEEAERLISKPAKDLGQAFHPTDIEFILEQADGHPYLLIRAGSVLWSIRERLHLSKKNQIAISKEHQPILLGHLKVEFEPVFNLYWFNLGPIERETLVAINSEEFEGVRNTVLASLEEKGLVKYITRKKTYTPFSPLFSEFITSAGNSEVVTSKLSLSGLEANLYEYLESNANRICSFEELSEKVWNEPFNGLDEERELLRRRIQVTVSRLRKKLQEYNGADIVSAREQGYRLTKSVKSS